MAAPQSSAIPPSNVEYGGDEISALVLDPGFSTTRAGFAGEDVPKSVTPSYYGTIPSGTEQKLVFGDNSIHTPIPGLTIRNPMSTDGTVEDWDVATKLWEYAITSRLTSAKPGDPISNGLNDKSSDLDVKMDGMDEEEKPLAENPLLMTEPGWNAGKNREKGIEIAMENWGCPAYWLARNGVLAAFSAGKPSALVIDVGASNVSITPVHDGIILRKGVARSPLAGNHVSSQVRLLFSTCVPPIPFNPHYLVSSKTPVDAGAPAQATYRTFTELTAPDVSFRHLQEERVFTEFKESVVQVWPGPGPFASVNPQGGSSNEDIVRAQPGRPFEMPDGWNQMFGPERYRPAESLFDARVALSDANNPPPSAAQTIPALIQSSLSQVDVDVRPHLLSNVVVTGGSSLLYGFTERLNQELMALHPGPRVRITAPGNTAERKFASWIGGSILASLGTFHQMWISKKEYEEHGAGIVEKRCK